MPKMKSITPLVAMRKKDLTLKLVIVFHVIIRDFLTVLRDVAGILRTTSAHAILRDMCIRFLARASINNRTETITAYCFTLQGRAEIRERESGFSTQNPDFALKSEFSGEVVDLKVYIKR
jgi:hypothetical protein